jgi:hypothetical protein
LLEDPRFALFLPYIHLFSMENESLEHQFKKATFR